LALVLAGALTAVLLSGAPALAGAWAVTSLDPLPDRIEPGRAYTMGFWVLQHGSHPYSGVLDPVGLKFVKDNGDDKGTATTFAGVALPEPAHYAAAVILPAPGTWQVFGVQGPFQDYRIGTLTVPGGLSVLAVPPPLDVDADQQPWGAIRPPQMPVDPGRDPFGDPGAAAGSTRVPGQAAGSTRVPDPAAATQPAGPANPADRAGLPGTVIVAAVAAVAGAVVATLGLVVLRRPRARRLVRAMVADRHPRADESRPRRELIG
jgi:hypothetical protein